MKAAIDAWAAAAGITSGGLFRPVTKSGNVWEFGLTFATIAAG